MDFDTMKFIFTSGIQVFLGVGAWFFGWHIAKTQLDIRKAELRKQMFDDRYSVYFAFETFLKHCVCYEPCLPEALRKFVDETLKVDFLFGSEIRRYRRQILANAIAMKGIYEGRPCGDVPVVGGIVGYFKGSTNLETIEEIQSWFAKQVQQDLRVYFSPYLDYGLAGVDTKLIIMNPPDLPDPPMVRRRTSGRPESKPDEQAKD